MNRRLPLCPSCGERKMLGSEQRKYNAKSLLTGKQICIECKVDELKRLTR